MSISDNLFAAIYRHRAAQAAFEARPDESDATLDRLNGAANAALSALVKTPCGSDAELVTKLRYLLGYWLKVTSGERTYERHEFGDVVAALDLHCNRAEPALPTPAVPWWRDRLAWLALLACRFLARRALALVHAEV